MTDEEMAKADAEYDALPGTPPNGYSFRSHAEIGTRAKTDVIREMHGLHPEAEFLRATITEDGLWVEFWDARPYKQAPFNPPMVAAP